MKSIKKENLKPLLNLVYSILGLVVFNGIIQFVLYPFLNKQLGEASFGVVLTLLSVIAVISGSFGTATNNARMVFPNESDSKNGDYNILLLLFNVIGFAVVSIFLLIYNIFDIVNVIFVNLLMFITMFRYYADVEYRKSLNYFSFMIYYVLIGIGYAIGCLLYNIIPIWQISMLIGEGLAIIFVLIKGNVFKSFFNISSYRKKIWKLALSLAIGELIANLILNADRILLYAFIDGEAVTTYYVASLVGKIVALVTVPLIGVIMGYLARMENKPTKKFYLVYFLADLLLGVCAFVGCMIVSPFLIKILYPDIFEQASEILLFAILAQVVFFCSNLLNVLLLKFYDSKVQLILSVTHLVIFVTCCLIGIFNDGLFGFSVANLIGNSIKLILILGVLIFLNNKRYFYKGGVVQNETIYKQE